MTLELRERSRGQDVSATRGAEGATSIIRGKLSGKRTVIHVSSGESLFWATEGEIPETIGQGVISQVKGQGSFGIHSEAPLFFWEGASDV